MKIELLTGSAQLASVSGRWDELARAESRDGFFRTSGWYRAWMNHIRPDSEPLVIVASNPEGRIVGLAPLCRGWYSDLGFRMTAVSFGGREVVSGDFLDFLVEEGSGPQVAHAIFNALWEQRGRWGLLAMGELIEGGVSDDAFTSWSEQRGLTLRRQEERLCPYIALPESFEKYLAMLGSSTRYHIRRRIRDVEKQGGRVESYTGPREIADRLGTFIRLHQARWRRDNQPGTLGRPGFAAFLHEICTNPPAHSSCRLYELSHEGTASAALLTFYFGESALYYQAGWDPDSPLAQFSPGVVLMAHSIGEAIQHGARYYEFLRGDEAYKTRWTQTHRKTVTLLAARSLTARAYLTSSRLKDAVKHRFPDTWGRMTTVAPPPPKDVVCDENARGSR